MNNQITLVPYHYPNIYVYDYKNDKVKNSPQGAFAQIQHTMNKKNCDLR